ncbi:MAG: hypothetical protein OEW11_04325 [Nitrospirota bacterium]|nr:hypothetical protein [Nitrospirota bacterium]
MARCAARTIGALALLAAMMCAGCALSGHNTVEPGAARVVVADRQDAVAHFLSGRELQPLEGVWVWWDDSFEVAIIPNRTGTFPEHEFVAVVTASQVSGWQRPGRVQMFIRATACDPVYTVRIGYPDFRTGGGRLTRMSPDRLKLQFTLGDQVGEAELYRVQPSGSLAPSGTGTAGTSTTTAGECLPGGPEKG